MALEASADERLTRGLTSMTAYSRRIGRQRELDVAAALHAQRADDVERRGAQPLVDRVGQGLHRRHDHRIAGVHAQRVDVLHGAHRDAGVGRVAHDLVLDLLPAGQVALDHDLADGAQAQAGAHPLIEGLAGVDDAAAGAAQREGRPDDGRQADARRRRARWPPHVRPSVAPSTMTEGA